MGSMIYIIMHHFTEIIMIQTSNGGFSRNITDWMDRN